MHKIYFNGVMMCCKSHENMPDFSSRLIILDEECYKGKTVYERSCEHSPFSSHTGKKYDTGEDVFGTPFVTI
jgi:hypothetical protein